MGLDKIVFDPYNKLATKNALQIIEEYIACNNNPDSILLALARLTYNDYSVGWEDILEHVFSKNGHLVHCLKLYIGSAEGISNTKLPPELVNLITFLISKDILQSELITEGIIEKLNNPDSKQILFSFLVSWDIDKAISLDKKYVSEHFAHVVDASSIPIKDLILKTNEETYLNVVLNILNNPSTHYYIIQEIQKIIRNNPTDNDSETLEIFFEECNKSIDDNVIEFITDVLEIKTIRKFLELRWENILCEKLYKNFAIRKDSLSEISTRRAIYTLNSLKEKQDENFSLAARFEINQLTDNDRETIYNEVLLKSSKKINLFSEILLIEQRKSWDWKDYANLLVKKYKQKYSEEEIIDIRKLAKDLGLEIVEKRFETESFDACLVRDNTLISPIIVVNTNKKSRGRVNFSIAHEIAHAVIPEHANKSFFCFLDDVTESNRIKMDKHLETEANYFASYLLLPPKQFKEEINGMNFDIEHVKSLSLKYHVSLVLVAKKWVELSELEIAVLFSTDGTVDWWAKSENFPIKYINFSAHYSSSIYEAIKDDRRTSFRKQINSNMWSDNQHFSYTLLEETMRIFDKKTLTLLQVVEH